MRLQDLYERDGYAALKRLAEGTGTSVEYMRNLAYAPIKGSRGKRIVPSLRLALKMVEVEPELTVAELADPVAYDRSALQVRRKSSRRLDSAKQSS